MLYFFNVSWIYFLLLLFRKLRILFIIINLFFVFLWLYYIIWFFFLWFIQLCCIFNLLNYLILGLVFFFILYGFYLFTIWRFLIINFWLISFCFFLYLRLVLFMLYLRFILIFLNHSFIIMSFILCFLASNWNIIVFFRLICLFSRLIVLVFIDIFLFIFLFFYFIGFSLIRLNSFVLTDLCFITFLFTIWSLWVIKKRLCCLLSLNKYFFIRIMMLVCHLIYLYHWLKH